MFSIKIKTKFILAYGGLFFKSYRLFKLHLTEKRFPIHYGRLVALQKIFFDIFDNTGTFSKSNSHVYGIVYNNNNNM